MGGPDAKRHGIGPLPPPERKDLEAEFAGNGEAKELVIGLLSPPERKLPQNVMAGLLIAAMIYSGYYVLASARRGAEPPVIPVPAQLAAEAGLTQKYVPAAPLAAGEQPTRTSPNPSLAPSTEVAAAEPDSVRVLATVEPEAASLPEVALSPPDAAPTQPVAAPSQPASRFHAPLPLGRRYGMANSDSRIILRVHRSTRLAVQGTGDRILIDRILDAGDTYPLPNIVGL